MKGRKVRKGALGRTNRREIGACTKELAKFIVTFGCFFQDIHLNKFIRLKVF